MLDRVTCDLDKTDAARVVQEAIAEVVTGSRKVATTLRHSPASRSLAVANNTYDIRR